MARYDITDAEWSVIQPVLPQKSRGVPRVDDRRVLNGIFGEQVTRSPMRREIPPIQTFQISQSTSLSKWTEPQALHLGNPPPESQMALGVLCHTTGFCIAQRLYIAQ